MDLIKATFAWGFRVSVALVVAMLATTVEFLLQIIIPGFQLLLPFPEELGVFGSVFMLTLLGPKVVGSLRGK